MIDEPLGKSQCVGCGIVQRTEFRYLGLTDFYEKRYDTYYERLGTQVFNKDRYAEIARWVSCSIGDFAPESIIEVGCGRGWTLREIQKIYPSATIEGIEPSLDNSEEARTLGFRVLTGKLDLNNLPGSKYDLVFSNHVLQHTTDPDGFFRAMGEVVSSRGLIVATVQDSSFPSNELLYSDQNFSFLPHHIVHIAEGAGLRVLAWKKASETDSLRLSQLIVCCKKTDGSRSLEGGDQWRMPNEEFQDQLYRRRVQYLEAWSRIAEYLCWKTSKNRGIYNFGAGMYSYLLACYCDEYWKRVAMCVLDGFSGEFVGKQVVPIETLPRDERDCVVMGTRPSIQRMLASRIVDLGWEAICWDNFVDG